MTFTKSSFCYSLWTITNCLFFFYFVYFSIICLFVIHMRASFFWWHSHSIACHQLYYSHQFHFKPDFWISSFLFFFLFSSRHSLWWKANYHELVRTRNFRSTNEMNGGLVNHLLNKEKKIKKDNNLLFINLVDENLLSLKVHLIRLCCTAYSKCYCNF